MEKRGCRDRCQKAMLRVWASLFPSQLSIHVAVLELFSEVDHGLRQLVLKTGLDDGCDCCAIL